MISFHTPLTPDRRKMMIADSSRKRKWDEVEDEEEEEEKSKVDDFMENKRPGSRKRGSSVLDMELDLKAPSPVEWQRCLNIQSGEEVHFFDARTNKRTCKDSDKDSTGRRRTVRLNLELNLQPYDEYLSPQEGETTSSMKRRPIVEEEEEEEEEEEMVATVCMRCHMLVMLCVSRPLCPNCKFVHPKPDQILFKPPPKCTSTAQLLC